MSLLIAHQGGWDEVLLFVGPVALAFLIVNLLDRRGRRRRESHEDSEQNSVP